MLDIRSNSAPRRAHEGAPAVRDAAGDRPVRVVFFDEAVAFGGSVVVLSHLLKHLDRTRFSPYVITSLDESSIDALFLEKDVLHRYRPKLQYAARLKWMAYCPFSGLLKRLWAYLFAVAAMLVNLPALLSLLCKVVKIRPTLIHVNNGTEGLLIARLLRVPFVWHLHGVSFELSANTHKGRTNAAAFVSISKHIASEATRSGVAPDRIIEVPNPALKATAPSCSRAEWRRKYGMGEDKIALAHVGRMVRWKGQLEFIEAFARIAAEYPHAVALLVGDDVEGFTEDYPAEVRESVRAKGLSDRVIFTGHVSSIMELMQFVDIVVHSSIEPEPFGLVITEAMSAGTAVVAARLGAPTEIVQHGVTGLLVDPKDPSEFADALRVLVGDHDTRQRLAAAGQAAATQRYSPELFAQRIEAVYGDVLAAAQHG